MPELSIKLKGKLAKKIYKLSKDTNKDSSFHINKALENYFDEMEDLNIALKRVKNKSDNVISSSQLKKSLGL
jgi:predicted DNA-binding protein